MHPRVQAGTELHIDPDDIHDEYNRAGFIELSDAELFDRAARAVSTPRQQEANSFVLHAPLELMARRLLLPYVPPRLRRTARERMISVAARYGRIGDPVEPPPTAVYNSTDDARTALLGALAEGDLDAVDVSASQFLQQATLDETMTLAEPTIESLAAAGHAPLGFFLASRMAPTSRSALALLRPTFRELARAPQLRVQWVRDADAPAGDETSFTTALAHTPQLGLPGSDFIFPVVNQVDRSGLARELINECIPADVTTAAAVILRVAVRSMLQDDPAYAPYGWTHCLTLPHAIFAVMPWLRDPPRAAAIAATYVVGFRAAEGNRDLDTGWEPDPRSTNLLDALEAEPEIAAACWYHAPETAVARALPELIGRAAIHEDAHLVKYTLACLDAAERDRAHRSLYVAAAASLAARWTRQPDTAFRDDL
jgi:hypothetical protein